MGNNRFKNATGLHWFHWLIIFLSGALTLVAWKISSDQIDDKIQSRFKRESDRVVELVLERLQKYEDALWSGVAAIYSHENGQVSGQDWKMFANSLRVDTKYPGINGIGVIYNVKPENLSDFQKKEQSVRPYFKVYPTHERKEFWPITYIEPEKANFKAVGLDMAHEINRFTAAKKAAKTGEAQVTGPIVLVQDKEKTPGFLFYAPFYENLEHLGDKNDDSKIRGLVYAPFIAKKLMDGTLSAEQREVSISIHDGSEPLYSEHSSSSKNSKFHRMKSVDVYGRTWVFDIRSKPSLVHSTASSQPYIILFGGITIDTLLIILFIAMGRTNQKALTYAEQMHKEAEYQRGIAVNSAKLASLGEMAGGVAHEINNPLAIVHGSVKAMKRIIAKKGYNDPELERFCSNVEETALRMAKIVKSMKALSRDGQSDPLEPVLIKDLISDSLGITTEKFKNNGVDLKIIPYDDTLKVDCRRTEIAQVLVNLLSNAFDAVMEKELRWIQLEVKTNSNNCAEVSVTDSGSGIPQTLEKKILDPFFTTKKVGKGTGLGLSISKTILEKHNGELILGKDPSGHTQFTIKIPLHQKVESNTGANIQRTAS